MPSIASPAGRDAHVLELHTLLGDYAITRALKAGEVHSPGVHLAFADEKRPSNAFKRVVRELEFDVAELALMTFLIAKAYGKPLVLLPAVVLARFQHPYLVYNTEHGPLLPEDLVGKRVGIRAYSVTTSTWIRGILAEDYGVAPEQVRWVTFEEPHVAEYRDPVPVERAPRERTAVDMLLAGDLDAAILADDKLPDPRLARLIRDPAAAAHRWHARHGAIQVNHMVVVQEKLARERPDAVRQVYGLLAASRARAERAPDAIDLNAFGVESNRRNLEVAIDYAFAQRLIPRRFAVDELFDATTRGLGG